MGTQTIPFFIDKADGTGILIGVAATATVQYGSAAAASTPVTICGEAYSVTVDDTQNAAVKIVAAGATTFGFSIARVPPDMTTEAKATANKNTLIQGDNGLADILMNLGVRVATNADKGGYTLTPAYDRAKTAAKPEEVAVTVPAPVVNPTPVTVNPTPVTVNPTPLTVNPTVLDSAERAAITAEIERAGGMLAETKADTTVILEATTFTANEAMLTQDSRDVDGFIIGITTPSAAVTAFLRTDVARANPKRAATAETDGDWQLPAKRGAGYTLVFTHDGFRNPDGSADVTREVDVP